MKILSFTGGLVHRTTFGQNPCSLDHRAYEADATTS